MKAEFDARLDAIAETIEAAARLMEMAMMELHELRRDTMRGPRKVPMPTLAAA